MEVVADMAEVWFKGAPSITFHDPLAAAILFEPDLCTYESGLVTVETQSQSLAGLTHFRSQELNPPHRIAVTVDEKAFFRHYFEVVGG